MQHMHGIIPLLLDCWADPVAHLLLLKSSMSCQLLTRCLLEICRQQVSLMEVALSATQLTFRALTNSESLEEKILRAQLYFSALTAAESLANRVDLWPILFFSFDWCRSVTVNFRYHRVPTFLVANNGETIHSPSNHYFLLILCSSNHPPLLLSNLSADRRRSPSRRSLRVVYYSVIT